MRAMNWGLGAALKTLFGRALAREVALPVAARASEVGYPLVRSARSGTDYTNAELADLLADDDAERDAR